MLRAPFRVAFFPLRLVARGIEAVAAFVGPRYAEPKPRNVGPAKSGPKVEPSAPRSPTAYFDLGASVKDIGLGPAITWVGFPTADTRLRLASSWSLVDRRRVRFSGVGGEGRPVGFRLRADYDYKPNRRYFGIGNETPESNLSYYRLESINSEAALLLGASPFRQLRVMAGQSTLNPGRGYNGQPLLEVLFTPATAPFEHQGTQELWFGVAGDFAALDHDHNPSRGVHGRLDLRRTAGRRTSDPDYNEWRVEGRAYLPVFAKRRVFALRGVYAGIDPVGGTTVLPYYRLPVSQGPSRFIGYSSERFRDRQLALARVEYRWEIFHSLSAVALYELGQVAPNASSFRLRGTHRSVGGGLRLGRQDRNPIRLDIGKSVEGLHAAVVLNGDF